MKHLVWTLLIATLITAVCRTSCWSENMRLIPSDPLTKILCGFSPDKAESELRMDGAARETVSAQVVLVPGDQPDTVTARFSELRSADGKSSIPASAVRLQWVRYMEMSANTPNIPLDDLVAKAPASIPDPFWEDAERPVSSGSPQPLWIELEVPADASGGEYRGELTVAGKSGKSRLPVVVRVRAFQLTEEPHQRVIQWWNVPGRTFEALKPGTDEYWRHLEGMCELVRRHRQTDVRVPWSLVQRATDARGEPVWDTSLVEKFMDIAFKTGLSAVQFDAAGRPTKPLLQQDSRIESVEDNMGRLAAVQELVVRRKWRGRVLTSLADEPFIHHEQSYGQLLEKVREIAPDVGVVEAIESDNLGGLDIYVPKLSHLNLWWPRFEELKRQGETVWFYTCCHPTGRYPNRFLDQPLVAARALHWIGYLYGLDGYLHWGLNWYSADGDPYSEKGSNPWNLPPGDSQVAYPGKNGFIGSLRLSAMRDGLQDYEYLWTLERKLLMLKSRLGSEGAWMDPRQRPTELCRHVVQSFYDRTRDPNVLLDTRVAIADEIEALEATPLLYVQTSPPAGTSTPEGPIMINVRGVVTPGAKVSLNGVPIIAANISEKGCFIGEVFINAKSPEIVVQAELNGVTRECRRVFRVLE